MDPTTNLSPDQINMLMQMLGNPQTSQMAVPDQQSSLGQQGLGSMAGMGNAGMNSAVMQMGGMPPPSAAQPGQPQTFTGITPAAYSAMFGVPATTNPSYGGAPY